MSGDGTRSMRFQAQPPDTFAALQEAARRNGLRYLSGDPEQGIAMFSAGFTVMTFGEKVTARIREVAPGTVEVTFSSDPKFGIVGTWGRKGTSLDRLATALSQILPPAV